VTASDRLSLLMPWINGQAVTDAQVRRAVLRFLKGFAGQHLKLHTDAGMWNAYYTGSEKLKETRDSVISLLNAAFPPLDADRRGLEDISFEDLPPPLPCPSLRFGIWPNSSELLVDGDLHDLVPFLVLHLLTSRQVVVARCAAPFRGDWARHCGRLYVWKGRGRPKMFCSDACKTRHHDKVKYDREAADTKRQKRK
jgi:hypothetical protein